MTSSLSKNEPGAIIDFSIEQLQLCRGAVLSLSNHMPRRHATKTGESDGAMELLNKSETPKVDGDVSPELPWSFMRDSILNRVFVPRGSGSSAFCPCRRMV